MAEKCPLRSGEHLIDVKFPPVCRSQCHDQITKATQGKSVYDDYQGGVACCPDSITENSHDAIFRPDAGASRQYITVDQCGDCGLEIGETTYFFDCPYSSNDVNWHS